MGSFMCYNLHMKKSTLKLIVFTFWGIVASIIFYQLNKHPNPMIVPSTRRMISVAMYVCPFIGPLYWLFCHKLEE